MNKKHYIRFFLSLSFVFLIISVFSVSSRGETNLETLDGAGGLPEIQEKLRGITEEEKEVMEKIFALMQEIDAMDQAKSDIAADIKKLNQEVSDLEALIASETLVYEKNREVMGAVLKAYQRNGPGTYLEMILGSDNLTTLLRRINALGDITKNTSELLESLEESRITLVSQKREVAEKYARMEDQQKKLTETLEEKTKRKEDLQTYLMSLEEEQIKYEEYLSNIEQAWTQLKPLFSDTIKTFSHIIEKGDFPPDAIKIDFSSIPIEGIIEEKTFNDIISEESFPTALAFKFSRNKLEMVMPEKNIHLSGKFVILEGRKLVFQVEEGYFFEMPLEKSAIEGLFREGKLELNLKPLLGKSAIKSIQIYDDHIKLQITPVLF
ncbi:MAG: coiled-coil domain-containing protein [Bacillota bacterium]